MGKFRQGTSLVPFHGLRETGSPVPMSARPNILVFVVDQLTGTLFRDGPAAFLHAPNLARLAERSARYANSYCPSPLCAPARAAFMSGLLPSRTGVFDNAAEFPSAVPTWAHHLRRLGYKTNLSGKMHFVGPDQLHGFEVRTTTDVYPADFGWTPDWRNPHERIDWWYHNLGSVTQAGTAEITNQMEFDDEVAFHAVQSLHQWARRKDERPWALCASFTHPHDPFVARERFWNLYPDVAMPDVPAIPYEDQDPHSRRLMEMSDHTQFRITDEDVLRSRRAYYANISYLDEKIGAILDTVGACGFADDTAIVFMSDHGEMLGERGLWFKMSFFEGSASVPLMVCAPGVEPGLVERPVSTLDLLPTLCEIAGGEAPAGVDGTSLMASERGPVFVEYMAEGSVAPMVMVRDGDLKLVRCPADPDQMFDLAADARELENIAETSPERDRLGALIDAHVGEWSALDRAVRDSQSARLLVYDALRNGAYYPWDHQPIQLASERYMRNHMDLNEVEAGNRYPPTGTPYRDNRT